MQIILQKNDSFLSKVIRFFCRGPYSHAALLLPDGKVWQCLPLAKVEQFDTIYHAFGHGDILDIYDVETTPEQDAIIAEFLSRQEGKGYDYWSLTGFVLYSTEKARKSYGKWFCSELVFATFKKVEIYLLKNIPAWEISPTDIYKSPVPKFSTRIVI